MFLRGMGFTFDDTDQKGVASSLAEMHRLIAANPRNREVIFTYIGGEEVNASPPTPITAMSINFRDLPALPGGDRRGGGKRWTSAKRQECLR